MNSKKERLSARQLELLKELYIEGIEQADGKKVATVLEYSLHDSDLEEMIAQINVHFASELGVENLAKTVTDLAHEHLPSAFEQEAVPERPITVGDVTHQLFLKNRIPSNDLPDGERLRDSEEPLPASLTLSEIKRIATSLKVRVSERFWSVFRKEAIFLTLRQSQQRASYAMRRKRLEKGKSK